MKKLILTTATLLLFASCRPAYIRYAHHTRPNCATLTKGDTVRVHSIGTHTDFIIAGDTTHNRYAAWNTKTGFLALIAKSNLKLIRNGKEF